jgi:hypothetical protein
MQYIPNVVFILSLAVAIWYFSKNVGRIKRNINFGKDINRSDDKSARWKTMLRVAFGQSKMQARPIAGFFSLYHLRRVLAH